MRVRLQQAIHGFGTALERTPTAAEAATQDPAVRELTGGEALNKTLSTSPAGAPRLGDRVRGADRADGPRAVADDLGPRPRERRARARGTQLTALISEFDKTMQATAAQQQSLRQTIALLGPTAQNANTAFGALDQALPATERFARDLARGIPQLPATIDAAYPWLAQAGPLLSKSELGGLLHELAPATGDLRELTHAKLQFLPQIDEFDRCITGVFLPTGNIVVNDGPLSTGVPNYQEFWYAMAGQAAEAQSADGNGNFLRIGAAGGPTRSRPGRPTTTARRARSSLRPICRRCRRARRIRIGSRR